MKAKQQHRGTVNLITDFKSCTENTKKSKVKNKKQKTKKQK